MNLILNKKRKITKKVCGQDISIIPYIDSKKKQYLIDKLIQFYNELSSDSDNYTKVVCELRANFDSIVIMANTDVTISPEDDYDEMVTSGLIDTIRKYIINYDEVYIDAMNVISVIKMSEMLPTVDTIDGGMGRLIESISNMSDEQKNNFEIFVKAAAANTANSAILQSTKGGE